MKEAIIVNLDGYMTDVTLVADDVTGVFPIYQQPGKSESEEVVEPVLTGHTVAVPVTPGLYKPRFDFAAWETYQTTLEAYRISLATWQGTPEEDRASEPPSWTGEMSACWIEGLTQEELDAIKNTVPPKSTEQKLEESLALVAQLRQEIAVQKDINAANSADFMALVDYLAEKGVLD
ncbi:hypothetical protein [Paenibacillus rigui]|uniref:Bacteriophage SP-beta YorD domain-containing protein n=1 Tax=Paenibacillus rigui TaxID=554312 RepID=A0A229UMG0_9BACL|nr:hypothetical protein [Paenibacillus rigui]OXM84616.1 hypothetical protein CF651_19105 [Paenibacillus rigui]